ncbi:MAG TPA: SulP family inorganic anion transporter [Vicinamibacterales bacterium]|nr:SulP family inorganic anion transporter [Vicinamibacterales bacterium]
MTHLPAPLARLPFLRMLERRRRLPRLATTLRGYDRRAFGADVAAGVTVGLVALPLAMAFAIASGLSPQAGLYCAVVTGFVVSALGGSRVQIAGPTGAFVVVVAGIAAKHGVDGLFTCTMMAGVLLILMGVTGMGSAVRFIPRPVVVGFTNGIAVLIASTQIRDFFGLTLASVPGEFWPRMVALGAAFHTISWPATALAGVGLALILLTNRFVPRVPGSILALVALTIVARALRLPVETIGTRFGGIPSGLPHVAVPTFHPSLVPGLIAPAVTVAMLGAIESLMSAMVADKMIGDRHNSNMELIAQGVANVVSPLVGGLPATGAIARTATNIRSGARTPIAGIVHALTLLVILLVAAPLAGAIPLAVLAAILMIVSWNMGEWREIPELLRLTKTDISVWLATFGLTVFADLTVAVEVGMVLAALLFIHRVAHTTTVSMVTDEYVREGHAHSLQHQDIPDYVRIFRIHGPFLFGATDKLHVVADHLDGLPDIVILRLRNMTALDGTGLRAIEELADTLHRSQRDLILCGAKHQPLQLMARADFHRHVGDANICANIREALARARQLHELRRLAREGVVA